MLNGLSGAKNVAYALAVKQRLDRQPSSTRCNLVSWFVHTLCHSELAIRQVIAG